MAKLILSARPLKPGEFKADPRPADLEAIGEFVNSCSLLEISLHSVIRAVLSIDEPVARMLIGERRRTRELLDLMRFAFEYQSALVLPKEARALIDPLCQRVEYVNRVRSIVAHFPCNTDGIALEFHDAMTAKDTSKVRRYVCTAAQLKNGAEHALDVAMSFRDLVTSRVWPHYICSVRELLASAQKSDLPDDPTSTNQRTPKPKRRPRSSPK